MEIYISTDRTQWEQVYFADIDRFKNDIKKHLGNAPQRLIKTVIDEIEISKDTYKKYFDNMNLYSDTPHWFYVKAKCLLKTDSTDNVYVFIFKCKLNLISYSVIPANAEDTTIKLQLIEVHIPPYDRIEFQEIKTEEDYKTVWGDDLK